jgi:predicted nuclease of predicted toxin-antitoxin system
MKILVDENIPRMTVTVLRRLGHEVKDIRGSAEQGLTDLALWEVALNEGRLLITTDKALPATAETGISEY